jgi:hypothetical protein
MTNSPTTPGGLDPIQRQENQTSKADIATMNNIN